MFESVWEILDTKRRCAGRQPGRLTGKDRVTGRENDRERKIKLDEEYNELITRVALADDPETMKLLEAKETPQMEDVS